jgi:exosortase/archaeosortase family protein
MKSLQKYKSDWPIVTFLVKFVLLFALFYCLTYGFIGITVPGGLYSEWLAKNFNYVAAFRSFLLHSASAVISLFGYKSIVVGYYLFVLNGATIRMIYSCIGLGILSFWWAFVLAFPQTVAAKARYFIIGSLLIIIMNIIRVSALAMIYSRYKHRVVYNAVDHHLIFEICVYAVLFFMIYKWLNAPVNNAQKTKNE